MKLRWLFEQRQDRCGSGGSPADLLSVSIHRGVVSRFTESDDLPRADDLSLYKIVDPGDIVLNRMRAFQGAVGIARRRGIVSPDYTVLQASSGADPRYFHHLLRSHLFVGEMVLRLRGIGSTDTGSVRTPRINWEDLGDIDVTAPPLAEQRAIADYLDAETARIDALIAKKQQLIHLLEERCGQWIRDAFVRFSPWVPLKRGWSVTDCQHRTPEYEPAGYPVVSPGDTTPGRLSLDRCHRFVGESDFISLTSGGRLPKRGDVVYSRNASIGIASFVDTTTPFCMGQDVCLISSERNSGLLLSYALNSIGVDQLAELKLGSTFSRVNIGQIVELRVPLPSVQEQEELAARFDERKEHHDRTVAHLTRQIGLLAERRQALITAAVTGEFAVPGAP